LNNFISTISLHQKPSNNQLTYDEWKKRWEEIDKIVVGGGARDELFRQITNKLFDESFGLVRYCIGAPGTDDKWEFCGWDDRYVTSADIADSTEPYRRQVLGCDIIEHLNNEIKGDSDKSFSSRLKVSIYYAAKRLKVIKANNIDISNPGEFTNYTACRLKIVGRYLSELTQEIGGEILPNMLTEMQKKTLAERLGKGRSVKAATVDELLALYSRRFSVPLDIGVENEIRVRRPRIQPPFEVIESAGEFEEKIHKMSAALTRDGFCSDMHRLLRLFSTRTLVHFLTHGYDPYHILNYTKIQNKLASSVQGTDDRAKIENVTCKTSETDNTSIITEIQPHELTVCCNEQKIFDCVIACYLFAEGSTFVWNTSRAKKNVTRYNDDKYVSLLERICEETGQNSADITSIKNAKHYEKYIETLQEVFEVKGMGSIQGRAPV
jgi:hypothetical protein